MEHREALLALERQQAEAEARQKREIETIRAREEHGLLHLTVADNGYKPPSPGDGGSGIGLANVRDRLSARFGDQGRIDYGPQADGGFAVNLFLPLNRRGC